MRKVFGAFAEGVILRVTPSAREKHYRYLWGNMTAEGSPHKKGPSANAWVTFRKKVQETSAEGEKRTTMLEFPQSSMKFWEGRGQREFPSEGTEKQKAAPGS